MSLNEVLGGEKNYLGMLGGYNGGSTSGQAAGSWDSTVAAWRADNPTYQVLPQVEISGRRETAEYQLNVAFGLNKQVTFSDANPSRVEAHLNPRDNILGNVIGAVFETPMAIASSILGGVVGPAAGIVNGFTNGKYGTPEGIREASELAGSIARAISYRPSTVTGQKFTQTIGEWANDSGIAGLGFSELNALQAVTSSAMAMRAGASVVPELQQAGVSRLALPRTEGLGSTSTTAKLLSSGAIPGRQGVVLQQRTVPYADIWQMSEKSGVEFVLTKEDGSWMLRSGSPTSAPIPGGVRPTLHTHPLDADGLNSLLPSKADINVLNNYWARNPTIPRPVSQILTGQPEPTRFYATGLDPWH